jgi:hypothetical protein
MPIPAGSPDATLPIPTSLRGLLTGFAPLFAAPSFRTFCGLACGFLTQAGRRTVCDMLAGAGVARAWPHDRAHQLFSRAYWNADDLGLAAARIVVSLLVPAGQPVTVAIDDTLFKRRGKKVRAAGWFGGGQPAFSLPGLGLDHGQARVAASATILRPSGPESVPATQSQGPDNRASPQLRLGGAGGARTHDRRIMRTTASGTVSASCTDTTEPCHRWS